MQQTLNRRTVLECIAAVAASTAFGCSEEETPRQEGRVFFPQSVASGDPRPDSVVLWTRGVDPERATENTALKLQVSESDSFATLVLDLDVTARTAHDHAVKVKVTGLKARTTYYYRFNYEKAGERYSSPVGRTRTAPATGDNVPVKFAFASCQDYIGRYYNAWQRLLQLDEDLDFVVFLGDYIYETTGDASFQSSSGGGRTVQFSDTAGALPQHTGFLEYYAASTVSNYRDCYKTVRTDPVFQQVHERYPFVVVWDDHEFSDDSWQANATYEDGKRDERQEDRRRNAEQAFFEYIPLDHEGTAAGAVDVAAVPRFPNTRIYRDFQFGQHLRLVVTDTRTFRPDHVIPEDAYPGKVAVPQEVLTGGGQAPLPPSVDSPLFAYVNIDDAQYAGQRQVLRGAYVQQAMAAGLSQTEAGTKAAAGVSGALALAYINEVLTRANVTGAGPIDPAGKLRGIAFLHMGKVGPFDLRGSRYVVVKDTFDVYSRVKYGGSARASENVLGTAQETWFRDVVKGAGTWKVMVSSVSLTAMVWDLRNKADIPDPTLRQRFYFNVDQWDGFPNKKAELLGYLSTGVSNPLFISGDIHASFASVEGGIPTLTTPGISSGSIKELAATAVRGAGFTTESSLFRHTVTNMDQAFREGNTGMVYSNTDAHGFVVLEVRADEALASFHLIPSSEVGFDYSKRDPGALAAKFTRHNFRVRNKAITPL